MIRPDGTADDHIVSRLSPADRIPSVGTQEPLPLAPLTWAERYQPTRKAPPAPERLTLWDQPAELWSTDR